MEIELRFKIDSNFTKIKKKIEQSGYFFENTQYQLDEYYKLKGNEKESDVPGSKIFRIRNIENGHICTIKETVEPGAWKETEVEESTISEAAKIILKSYFSKILIIEKNRDTYKKENYTLNVDFITGLGTFIEFEVISECDPNKIKDDIREEVSRIFNGQIKLVEKGYVTLMKEELNKKESYE